MVEICDDLELNGEVSETSEEISARAGVYGEIKHALIARGIPAAEIAFIHDFQTPAKKAQAFADCNAGRIRVLLASTEKAGTGVNMQERLYALHHLDVPWRPSDVEQREGRILRQGNTHKEVHICQYVTEGSFDAYMWQTLESKARFISQIMAGEVTARTAEDVDQLVMTAAQIKAIASGNPQILEKVGLEVELTRLERLYSVWNAGRQRLRHQVESLPAEIAGAAQYVAGHERAVAARAQYAASQAADDFRMRLKKSPTTDEFIAFKDRQRAGAHLRQLSFMAAREGQLMRRYSFVVGDYRGFEVIIQGGRASADRLGALFSQPELALRVKTAEREALTYSCNVGESDIGIIQSMDAQLRGLETKLEQARRTEQELRHRCEQAGAELGKGWEHADRYQEMKAHLATINAALGRAGCEVEPSPELANLDADALRPVPTVSVRQLVSVTAEDESTAGEDISAAERNELASARPPAPSPQAASSADEQVIDSSIQSAAASGANVNDGQVAEKPDLVQDTILIKQPEAAPARKSKAGKRPLASPAPTSGDAQQLTFSWA